MKLNPATKPEVSATEQLMALVALASAKGSPGVTTASLVFGALWPRQVLLAECDPAGGDVAIRMTAPAGAPLGSDRGLVSLAAASPEAWATT